MNRRVGLYGAGLLARTAGLVLSLTALAGASSPDFDFQQLEKISHDYQVIVRIQIEFSFGMQSNEHEQRLLGVVVREDGLVMFHGGLLVESNPLSVMSSLTFKTTPTRIEIITLDEDKYEAEYIGADRETGLGFAQILNTEGKKFTPVKFVGDRQFTVGEWLALYMLLPEYVKPSLAGDVGMISTLVETPEELPLTIGFNSLELAAVMFDSNLNAVGVLGTLEDPSSGGSGSNALMEPFGRFDLPLLTVIKGERLEELIADPPQKGKIDRAWLGITMQALTPDIAGFLHIDAVGGIIVTDVMKDSPADHCKLIIGDVIYEINGQQVEIDQDEELPVFQRRIANMGAGTSVEFSIFRPSEEQLDTLRVLAVLTAAPLAAADAEEYENKNIEFKVRNLVFADFMLRNVEQGSLEGVVVSELKRGGLAHVGGLQLGDIIQRVDGEPVASVANVVERMAILKTEQPPEVIFFVWRDSKTLFVNVKTDW